MALKECPDHPAVVFADRSPYSAVFYAKTTEQNAELLRKLIASIARELAAHDIELFTFCVKVDKQVLWERI